eukprot:247056-Pelagomonas_calceolata.AAC.2
MQTSYADIDGGTKRPHDCTQGVQRIEQKRDALGGEGHLGCRRGQQELKRRLHRQLGKALFTCTCFFHAKVKSKLWLSICVVAATCACRSLQSDVHTNKSPFSKLWG